MAMQSAKRVKLELDVDISTYTDGYVAHTPEFSSKVRKTLEAAVSELLHSMRGQHRVLAAVDRKLLGPAGLKLFEDLDQLFSCEERIATKERDS